MYRVNTVWFQSGECVTATYTDNGNNYVKVDNAQYFISDAEHDQTFGAAQASSFISGLLNVRFSIMQPWAKYEILDTDYTSYAIVYSCGTYIAGLIKLNYLWVLTRDPLEINSGDWTSMKTATFSIINS